jgi:hypothetical protein
MKFVLVNERSPARSSVCAFCGVPIGNSYLREFDTQLYYCDRHCYEFHCEGVVDLYLPSSRRLGGPTFSSEAIFLSWDHAER